MVINPLPLRGKFLQFIAENPILQCPSSLYEVAKQLNAWCES